MDAETKQGQEAATAASATDHRDGDLALPCDSNCEHGGVCTLTEDHAGQHDSGYCRWTDTQAISQADADRIMRDRGYPQALLDLEAMARAAAKALTPRDDEASGTAPKAPTDPTPSPKASP